MRPRLNEILNKLLLLIIKTAIDKHFWCCYWRCKVLKDEVSNKDRLVDDPLPSKVKHHKSSLMSGYVVADSEALVMQKVGTNVEYKVTEECGY